MFRSKLFKGKLWRQFLGCETKWRWVWGQKDPRLDAAIVLGPVGDGDISVGWLSDWKARHNADAGSSPQCGKGFFSLSQLSVQTLSWCPYSPPPPRVQAHASSSVPTLKIPNTGNYTIGCTEIQHTLIGLGSTALSAPVPYPVKATQISCKRQWSTNKIKNKLIKAKGWGQFMQVVCPTKDEVQVRWMLLSVQTDWS